MTKPLDISQLQTLLQQERDDRARKCLTDIEAVCQHHHCRIVPEVIISGNQITTRLNVVALDAAPQAVATPNGTGAKDNEAP